MAPFLAAPFLAAAEAHYRRALQRMPHLAAACYGLVETAAEQRRFDAALEQLRACQRVYPDRGREVHFRQQVEQLRAGNGKPG